ncbi:MAG: YjjG family noncanonical pyrimidine nucleotidase [Saprospiraceae bacterium]|nr:YjjG family noncanonical pyrimidine nucleotidase [Saprospiraceae bacterium]
MKYSVFLFDADNTLLDFNRSEREAFSEMLEDMGVKEQFWHFPRYLTINKECWEQLEKGEISPEEVKTIRFERFFQLINKPADPEKAGLKYLQALSTKAYWEAGALDLLKNLQKQNLRLALVTNGLSSVQRPRFRHSGLDHFFSTIIISEEIGYAKPMRAFFDITFEALDQPDKKEMLLIGDTPGSDILGGQQFGLDTCWYNPKKREFPFDPGPTYEIRHLDGLSKLI